MAEAKYEYIERPPVARDSWMNRWFICLLIIDLLLTALFIVYGSVPARHARESSDTNHFLLCVALKDDSESLSGAVRVRVESLCLDQW